MLSGPPRARLSGVGARVAVRNIASSRASFDAVPSARRRRAVALRLRCVSVVRTGDHDRKEVTQMLNKMLMAIAALALVLSLSVPGAEARRGKDNPPEPPECQIEDGGVVVCK
jgi:erythromycin esterase-like protein